MLTHNTLLGAMKTAYEAGHHATVEGHYHEEWPDDHVYDWMDDEGITDPGYVRVDAERYRYLKDVSAFRVLSLDMSGKHTWTLVGRQIRGEGSTIDAAIDAARGKDNG